VLIPVNAPDVEDIGGNFPLLDKERKARGLPWVND